MNTSEDTAATDLKCKYKLRKKLEDAKAGDSGPKKRGPKPRLRSAGMSRYRRKEANARERQRQGEINTSFDKLREKIPHPGPSNGKCEKLRKIDILHVAINYIRALENILESGDPGVHHFANSVYKVGREDAGTSGYDDGSVLGGDDSDSFSEDSESMETNIYQLPAQHKLGFKNFQNQPHRSQRKITLTSRDDVLAINNFRQIKKPFPTHLLQPEHYQTQNLQYPSMQMNLKVEMVSADKSVDNLEKNMKEGVTKWQQDPSCRKENIPASGWSEMSLLSDFSDMSSSDPEDIFLPDLSSSLESLHNIEAFNFFNEKQNLAF